MPLAGCGSGVPADGSAVGKDASPEPGHQLETSILGFVSKAYVGTQDQCLSSTRAALTNLHLKINRESGAIFKREFEVEAEDGTTAVIDVSELTKASSRVTIKVGYLLGDEDAARRIHSEIEAEIASRRHEASEQSRKWKGVRDLEVQPTPSIRGRSETTTPPLGTNPRTDR